VKRLALNFLAGMSLMLVVVAVGFWISSYLLADFYKIGIGRGRGFEFDSSEGQYFLGTWSNSDYVVDFHHNMSEANWRFGDVDHCQHVWQLGPVTLVNETRYDLHNFWGARLPYWLATLAFMPLPVAWIWDRKHRRRRE
jgi:hypothetical protein